MAADIKLNNEVLWNTLKGNLASVRKKVDEWEPKEVDEELLKNELLSGIQSLDTYLNSDMPQTPRLNEILEKTTDRFNTFNETINQIIQQNQAEPYFGFYKQTLLNDLQAMLSLPNELAQDAKTPSLGSRLFSRIIETTTTVKEKFSDTKETISGIKTKFNSFWFSKETKQAPSNIPKVVQQRQALIARYEKSGTKTTYGLEDIPESPLHEEIHDFIEYLNEMGFSRVEINLYRKALDQLAEHSKEQPKLKQNLKDALLFMTSTYKVPKGSTRRAIFNKQLGELMEQAGLAEAPVPEVTTPEITTSDTPVQRDTMTLTQNLKIEITKTVQDWSTVAEMLGEKDSGDHLKSLVNDILETTPPEEAYEWYDEKLMVIEKILKQTHTGLQDILETRQLGGQTSPKIILEECLESLENIKNQLGDQNERTQTLKEALAEKSTAFFETLEQLDELKPRTERIDNTIKHINTIFQQNPKKLKKFANMVNYISTSLKDLDPKQQRDLLNRHLNYLIETAQIMRTQKVRTPEADLPLEQVINLYNKVKTLQKALLSKESKSPMEQTQEIFEPLLAEIHATTPPEANLERYNDLLENVNRYLDDMLNTFDQTAQLEAQSLEPKISSQTRLIEAKAFFERGCERLADLSEPPDVPSP